MQTAEQPGPYMHRLTNLRKIDLREATRACGVDVPESLALPENEPVFLPYQQR